MVDTLGDAVWVGRGVKVGFGSLLDNTAIGVKIIVGVGGDVGSSVKTLQARPS